MLFILLFVIKFHLSFCEEGLKGSESLLKDFFNLGDDVSNLLDFDV